MALPEIALAHAIILPQLGGFAREHDAPRLKHDCAVRELGSEIFLPVVQVQDEQLLIEIRALHEGILDAVRDHDAAQAERLMREHLEYTERTLFRAGAG